MKTKTFKLNHYDETFELMMSNGLDYELVVPNRSRVCKNCDYEPELLETSPEYSLKLWVEKGYVYQNINLAQVVSFVSKGKFNERIEEVTYNKHWFWGWRKV